MAAAPDNTSRLVCFCKVDPSFQFVMNAIAELQRNGRLQHVCTVTVGNNGLRSTSDNQQFGGRKPPNAFSRTLGSVLRAFMLRSTYLVWLNDPRFDSRADNLRANPAGYNRNVQPQGVPMAQLRIVQNVVQAQEISANFDRLYPHFFIENKLAAEDQGTEVNLPGMMVIVEMQGGVVVKLHTINATVRARHNGEMYGPMPQAHNGPNPHIFHCPDPIVVRVTSIVLGLQPGQLADMFPAVNRLMDIIHEHLEIVRGNREDNFVQQFKNQLDLGQRAQDQGAQEEEQEGEEGGEEEGEEEGGEEEDDNDNDDQ